jgi:hypothetical protein
VAGAQVPTSVISNRVSMSRTMPFAYTKLALGFTVLYEDGRVMDSEQRTWKLPACYVLHVLEAEKTKENKQLQKWQVLKKIKHYELSLSTIVTVTTTPKSR